MKWFYAAAILILLACSKNDPVEPDPVVPPVTPADTLNAWTKHPSGTTEFIGDIAFATPAKGFIVSSSEMRRSLDSGKTWLSMPSGTQMPALWVMNFFDPQFAYAIGWQNFVYTKDGGNTWSIRSLPNVPYDVIFVSQTTGVYVGPAGIYRTTDTGNNWTLVKAGSWTAVYFKNALEGWAGESGGGLYKSVDGGTNWTQISGNIPPNINAIGFSGQFGMATAAGSFLRTTDNGLTWQNIPALPGQFRDIEVLSPTLVYVTAGKEIRKSTDGGNTWTREMKLGTEDLIEINFTDSLHGWAAGTKGSIVRYVKN